jgi:hypothetical protein
MNIWKIFTPLHPSQEVVFLGIFGDFFIFFNFKFKILNGAVSNRPEPAPRPGAGSVNPAPTPKPFVLLFPS